MTAIATASTGARRIARQWKPDGCVHSQVLDVSPQPAATACWRATNNAMTTTPPREMGALRIAAASNSTSSVPPPAPRASPQFPVAMGSSVPASSAKMGTAHQPQGTVAATAANSKVAGHAQSSAPLAEPPAVATESPWMSKNATMETETAAMDVPRAAPSRRVSCAKPEVAHACPPPVETASRRVRRLATMETTSSVMGAPPSASKNPTAQAEAVPPFAGTARSFRAKSATMETFEMATVVPPPACWKLASTAQW